MMKIVAVIEARMTSTRLPGKVLMPINEMNSIQHITKRLKTIKNINTICLATTVNESDNVLIDLAKSLKIEVYRGSETDVLTRVLDAAALFSADIIVQITGDCPFVDPTLVDQFLQIFLSNKLDYISNNIIQSYPDGFDIQIFNAEALKRSSLEAHSVAEREHVTMHIRKNPKIFKTLSVIAPKPYRYPNLSVTLDTIEDLEVLRKIASYFGNAGMPNFMEITDFLLAHPEIAAINSYIPRKGFGV